MTGPCPYCGSPALEPTEAAAPGTEATSVARCHDCGRSSLVARPPDPPAPGDPAGGSGPGAGSSLHPRRAPGEGSSLVPALLGLAGTIAFYALLAVLPDSPVTELFARRGWVPYAITAISAWALALLAVRMRRLRHEAKALQVPLLPIAPEPSGRPDGAIRPADAESVLDLLGRQPPALAGSFLARRLARTLRHFASRRRVAEVVEYLASESRGDEQRVDASYSLVRVFVWAVPTLGFIGTVLGIGAAVGSFSQTLEAAASLEALKTSIGAVTSGLGIAFDTTLLALVMSILIMFPANAVQRSEEGLLAAIDDYCAEHLVRRLRDDPEDAEGGAAIEALARRLAVALADAAPAGGLGSGPPG